MERETRRVALSKAEGVTTLVGPAPQTIEDTGTEASVMELEDKLLKPTKARIPIMPALVVANQATLLEIALTRR